MTHSPAPWSVRRPTEAEIVGCVRKYLAIIAADGLSVCSFGATAKHGKRDPGTVDADALIVAAAPELYAALAELLAVHDMDAHRTRKVMPCDTPLAAAAITRARDAVLKAETRA